MQIPQERGRLASKESIQNRIPPLHCLDYVLHTQSIHHRCLQHGRQEVPKLLKGDENVINGTMADKNAKMKRPYSIAGGNVAKECTHVLDVPKENEMETELLPGFCYPSYHILIGAKFKVGCFQSSLLGVLITDWVNFSQDFSTIQTRAIFVYTCAWVCVLRVDPLTSLFTAGSWREP
eukprot:12679231-Ditylum_brightwellii.AAC.1